MPAPALNTGGNTFSGIEHLRNLLSAMKSTCLCSWHLVYPYIVHDSSPPTNFISRSHCIKIQEYLVDGTISCLHTITKLSLSPLDIPWSDTRKTTFPCPPPSQFFLGLLILDVRSPSIPSFLPLDHWPFRTSSHTTCFWRRYQRACLGMCFFCQQASIFLLRFSSLLIYVFGHADGVHTFCSDNTTANKRSCFTFSLSCKLRW